MVTKRYIVVREVVVWDSDKAYRDLTEYDDAHRQATAGKIAATRTAWKVVERPSVYAQEGTDG